MECANEPCAHNNGNRVCLIAAEVSINKAGICGVFQDTILDKLETPDVMDITEIAVAWAFFSQDYTDFLNKIYINLNNRRKNITDRRLNSI